MTTLGSAEPSWHPGATIVVRTVTHGRIRWAAPAIVVEDTEGQVAYYRPRGTTNKVTKGTRVVGSRRERELALRQELVDRSWDLVDHIPSPGQSTLVVANLQDWFSVWLRPNEEGGPFEPRYINIESPHRRTLLGFDTDDLCLDVVVTSDLQWHLKDDDDLRERTEAGIYSLEEQRTILGAARLAISRIEARTVPFDGSWAAWRPDPNWALPVLPSNWDEA